VHRGWVSDDESIDDFFQQILQMRFNSPEEALGALLTATTMINTAWPIAYGELGEQRQSRITKWLGDLREVTRRAARDFNASGFSITVGHPAGVSVTMTWPMS